MFHGDDGSVLDFPRPIPHEPVLPVEGPRWQLLWSGEPGTPMTLRQGESGRTLHFAPVAGRSAAELPLTAVTDRNGNRVRVEYDEDGLPSAVVHDGGYRVGVSTADGRISELRLLSASDQPTLLRYAYDERGNLSEIHNSSEAPLRLSYDARRRITGWQDRNGVWYRYTYDDAGRCVATEGMDGYLSSTIRYDAENYRTTFTDSLGHTSVFQFNDCYQLIAETDPLGHTARREWDLRPAAVDHRSAGTRHAVRLRCRRPSRRRDPAGRGPRHLLSRPAWPARRDHRSGGPDVAAELRLGGQPVGVGRSARGRDAVRV
ncbi:hypothetical protein E1265_17000 [Streptomyces sp. 8K308]|nr:hypothetical protein E1265_17000 [Streptomyces sp. 8K308]